MSGCAAGPRGGRRVRRGARGHRRRHPGRPRELRDQPGRRHGRDHRHADARLPAAAACGRRSASFALTAVFDGADVHRRSPIPRRRPTPRPGRRGGQQQLGRGADSGVARRREPRPGGSAMKATDRSILLGLLILGLLACFWFMLLAPKRERGVRAGDAGRRASRARSRPQEQLAAAAEQARADYAQNYERLVVLGKAAPGRRRHALAPGPALGARRAVEDRVREPHDRRATRMRPPRPARARRRPPTRTPRRRVPTSATPVEPVRAGPADRGQRRHAAARRDGRPRRARRAALLACSSPATSSRSPTSSRSLDSQVGANAQRRRGRRAPGDRQRLLDGARAARAATSPSTCRSPPTSCRTRRG